MPRVKASEYKAKKILSSYRGEKFLGHEVTTISPTVKLNPKTKYVVKVDDGSKRRFKRGLVGVDLSSEVAQKFISKLKNKNFLKLYVEPYIKHAPLEESYISLDRVREGVKVIASKSGGVDIESRDAEIFTVRNNAKLVSKIEAQTGIPKEFLEKLIEYFNNEHIGFLEINPFVVKNGKVYVLDLAVERDNAADFFVSEVWQEDNEDKTTGPKQKVQELAQTTPASLSLEIIDPNASIFMLLSGGGASLVLADAAHHKGHPEVLGNYGEYSGNPTREVVREYSGIILDMAIKSKSNIKAIVIAGGVANFTDILETFSGIVDSLEPRIEKLKTMKVKVFVRRGGPNEEKGREMLKKYLEKHNMLGSIGGSKIPLTKVMNDAIEFVTKK